MLVNVTHAQAMSFSPIGSTGGEPELTVQTGEGREAVVFRGARAEQVWR